MPTIYRRCHLCGLVTPARAGLWWYFVVRGVVVQRWVCRACDAAEPKRGPDRAERIV